ncbi:hypothetical protein MG293_010457 [Ovis ammon polii]|uniref:Uncharacterized protein n=1 Tax=Ovis ammon polii TaxID=230172 RepID=A0AAD4Y619_OVIAM|nr:hypothetical protein MG293_010457 [Ovis ammon polii]
MQAGWLPRPPQLQPGPRVPHSAVSADSSGRAEVRGASAHILSCDPLLGRVPLLLATEDVRSRASSAATPDANGPSHTVRSFREGLQSHTVKGRFSCSVSKTRFSFAATSGSALDFRGHLTKRPG